jgi:hypothetical protein
MISALITIAISLILLPPASADLSDGLVAFWPFYGNAHDESGNGNDGVVYGATLCEDRFGTANSAYCFDGVDDYINIGNDVKPPFPITVSAWVKPYDLHYNGCVFRNDRWDDTSYRYGLATMFNGQGESRSHVFEGFSACWNRRSKTSNDFVASTGNWHHFVVVFLAHDDMRHYWNGIALDGHSECFGSGMTYSSADGAIGHNISPTGDRYVKAAIDDVRVYNRALSDSEILDLFNENCSFVDVPPGYWAEEHICKIYETGITNGCSQDPLMFCPERTVKRWVAAVLIGRAFHGSDHTPPSPTGIFEDVSTSHYYADWMEQFYADGITNGCQKNPLMFCPDKLVTRWAAAVLLLRAKHGSSYVPPPATGLFNDVPLAYWWADWAEQFYREGITKGCLGNSLYFCPEKIVTREIMAVLIVRTFGL